MEYHRADMPVLQRITMRICQYKAAGAHLRTRIGRDNTSETISGLRAALVLRTKRLPGLTQMWIRHTLY